MTIDELHNFHKKLDKFLAKYDLQVGVINGQFEAPVTINVLIEEKDDDDIVKTCDTCKHYGEMDDYDIPVRCCECLVGNLQDRARRNNRELWEYPKWEAEDDIQSN